MDIWIGLGIAYLVIGFLWGSYAASVTPESYFENILQGMLWPFDAVRIFLG